MEQVSTEEAIEALHDKQGDQEIDVFRLLRRLETLEALYETLGKTIGRHGEAIYHIQNLTKALAKAIDGAL